MLQVLLRINDRRIVVATDTAKRLTIQQESLEWLQEEQRIRPQNFTLYRIGKLHLSTGDKEMHI